LRPKNKYQIIKKSGFNPTYKVFRFSGLFHNPISSPHVVKISTIQNSQQQQQMMKLWDEGLGLQHHTAMGAMLNDGCIGLAYIDPNSQNVLGLGTIRQPLESSCGFGSPQISTLFARSSVVAETLIYSLCAAALDLLKAKASNIGQGGGNANTQQEITFSIEMRETNMAAMALAKKLNWIPTSLNQRMDMGKGLITNAEIIFATVDWGLGP